MTDSGVADLISRSAALEVINAVKGVTWSQSGKVLCGKMFSQIKDLPAVDAVPVVHGRWIFHDDDIMPWVSCSECGICTDSTNKTSYCPNCGAKMDGERRDSDA